MKLTPLKQWICDSCGEIIEKPEEGWFEWYEDKKTSLGTGFRIVHHRNSCMYDDSMLNHQDKTTLDLNLKDVIGTDGLANSLFRIELSEKDIYTLADLKGFIEILRRLHIPYWEEARLYWDKAYRDGFHDGCDFSENTLLSVINEYRESP